jgi:hypothetical protein
LVPAAAVAAALALVQPASAASTDPSGSARRQLISLLDDVSSANGKSYQTRDSSGYAVDTIKIIQAGRSSYIGVYHVNQNGFFSVRVGTSSDLVHWQYVNVLEPSASQPTIAPLSDGSYLVAYEKHETSGDSHLEFRTYPTLLGLEIASSASKLDAPRTLSSVAEGTPSIHDVTLSPTLLRSTIHVGFHYYDTRLGGDRNARATLINFSSWTSKVATDINGALPVGGNIGGRDSLTLQGYPFTVVEAQGIAGDWSSWRVYVWDETAKTMTRIRPQTDAGSFAFANPKATVIVDPAGHRALVATMFIPSQGSAGNEAGPLIYWNEY